VEGIGSDYVKFYAEHFSEELEKTFFQGVAKYPAYRRDDIKNLLKYYTIQGEVPQYLPFSDREKYDIDNVAKGILAQRMTRLEEKTFIDTIWESQETAWQTFFNYGKQNLRREINLAMEKLIEPELYQSKQVKPVEENEIRTYEKMDMGEIYAVNPAYERDLRAKVFQKFTDGNGFYFSAMPPHFRSKNKADFRIDHIVSRFNGGLTVLSNLQLLTVHENAKKGRY
jgi:ATP-dependent helicase IRC3